MEFGEGLSLITRKVLARFQAVATGPSVLLNLEGSNSPKSTKGTVAKPTEYPTMNNTRPTIGSHSRPWLHYIDDRFKIKLKPPSPSPSYTLVFMLKVSPSSEL